MRSGSAGQIPVKVCSKESCKKARLHGGWQGWVGRPDGLLRATLNRVHAQPSAALQTARVSCGRERRRARRGRRARDLARSEHGVRLFRAMGRGDETQPQQAWRHDLFDPQARGTVGPGEGLAETSQGMGAEQATCGAVLRTRGCEHDDVLQVATACGRREARGADPFGVHRGRPRR